MYDVTLRAPAAPAAPAAPGPPSAGAPGPVQRAEDAFAALHGADAALLLPGVVAATTAALLALTNPGGHVIASDQTRDPLRRVLLAELTGARRTVSFVDCTEVDAVAAAVRPETQIVYTPSLSDPLMKLSQLNDVATYAQMNDLLLVVDNTVLSPAQLRPLETGAVVVIEDASPCLDEWGDLSAALVTCVNRYLVPIREQAGLLGGQVDPWAAHLLERSLSTLELRMTARQANAERVADALRGHPAVHTVHRPTFDEADWALETHQGFGALLSFEVVPEAGNLDGVLAAAGPRAAAGSTLTLPALTTHAHLSERLRREAGVSRRLVRVSVGIEDPAPLIRRLRQALDAALAPDAGATASAVSAAPASGAEGESC
ncbi:cystathionine beta-lyase [Streptomyces venezuelae]|uniref:PLP-dependent transferase n=1 Tax=Streptomyces venezuelae TaxID=54571 RepID=UPI0012A7EBAD|nr:PLP-dependent transferase [Streptomyces venezuelae]QES07002.1 cystathionine beta-lyase [Streptomyces venezuelae]